MNRCFALLVVVMSMSISMSARGDVELPAIFSDHMVIQRNQPVKVWGWADPGQEVICRIAANSQSTTTADDGKWSMTIAALPAGGPHTLSVQSGNQAIEVNDVLVGELWLCSGQSNMAMTVSRALDADKEIAAAELPMIRMFKVASPHATEPQDRCRGEWAVCSPETVGGFSATAYFFGRSIHQQLDVPIGLINSSVGGTAIESWTSMSAQLSEPAVAPVLQSWRQKNEAYDPDDAQKKYEKALAGWEKRRDKAKAAGNRIPRRPALAPVPAKDKNYPANLYNGKIHPIVGYGIRGAIWYQGERNSNSNLPHLYGEQLQMLIGGLARPMGTGRFSFWLGPVAELQSSANTAVGDKRVGACPRRDAEFAARCEHRDGHHRRRGRSGRYPSQEQTSRGPASGPLGAGRSVRSRHEPPQGARFDGTDLRIG